MDRKSIDVGFQVKALSDDGMIEGYGSVFGVRDSYSDIVAAGAFKASLAAHRAAGTMPALLWQHRSDEPIGVWTSMVEDQKGLAVVGQLAMDTTRGREAHALLKMRAINGLSIGFYSKEWKYDTENDVRTLTEVDLWETSLVTFPANSAARVTAVKSIETLESLREVEMMLRDRGFTKTEAVALVAKIKGMRPGDPVSPDGGPGDPVAELVAALKRRGSALA
ncbi:MAG: HK97 family phage prohead protease [Betaproteobacteria bacterium]|jgi:HK97 family phage prohead protease